MCRGSPHSTVSPEQLGLIYRHKPPLPTRCLFPSAVAINAMFSTGLHKSVSRSMAMHYSEENLFEDTEWLFIERWMSVKISEMFLIVTTLKNIPSTSPCHHFFRFRSWPTSPVLSLFKIISLLRNFITSS